MLGYSYEELARYAPQPADYPTYRVDAYEPRPYQDAHKRVMDFDCLEAAVSFVGNCELRLGRELCVMEVYDDGHEEIALCAEWDVDVLGGRYLA